ncbi:MAG: DUF2179 domain-containing protein [Deltaproteobacteria bacterium]|nr:DUF2179 domain-containing protein [Deltaproteobacteria bacterium]
MLTESLLINGIIIFLARILDVGLGTLRTMFIIRGSRFVSWCLGFVEIMIWIWVVSEVINGVKTEPWLSVFYALGFATGSAVGLTIEKWLAVGDKSVMLFTRKGREVSLTLRAGGFAVTELKGTGMDGPISLLFAQVPRKRVRALVQQARDRDESCFIVVESADSGYSLRPIAPPRTGWRVMGRKAK